MNNIDNTNAGADMLYAAGEPVFSLAAPMMLAQGWSVFPQERSGGRYPSKINGKSFQWGPLQDRLPTAEEMKAFCDDASKANVAATMGEASGKIFALDLDCMDADVCERIAGMATDMLGYTPFIRVGRAPKKALFYRYADLSPRTTVLRFQDHADCMLEVQGHGKLMTLYGLHHVTGRYFFWPDLSPLSASASEAPQVTVQQVENFLHAVKAEFKVAAPASTASAARISDFNAEVDAEGLYVPTVDVDQKLEDGREEYLKGVTWGLVWRNQDAVRAEVDAGQGEAMEIRLTDLAQRCFVGMCATGGKWTEHYLRTQASSKVAGAVQKLMDGKMKPYVAVKPKKEPEVTASGVEQVARMAAAAGRPVIRVSAGDIPAIVDAAEAALISGNAGLYQRGGKLVRMGDAPVITSDGIVGGRQIIPVEKFSLAESMGSHATFLRHDARKNDYVVTDVPMVVVETLAARQGYWKLPVLAGVVNAPTLRSDGSLLSAEGYDPRTGILLESGGSTWSIPDAPTKADAMAALGVLKGVISTFPFVAPVDRSVALSMFLTASVRRSLPTAPLHLVSARAAGSGKSKLADMASIIAGGRRASVVAMGRTDEETEKRLGAVLLTGDSVISIDNIEQPLGGDFLCQVLTQQVVRVRILGKSEVPELPTNALVTATGNNARVHGDMTRRTLPCYLDAGVENPELRVFDTDPVEVVLSNRKLYVEACLTVLRAFVVAGKPKQTTRLGSFEAWSAMVRDALMWLGEVDPVDSMASVRAEDPERQKKEAVFTTWHAAFGSTPMAAKDVIAAANRKDEFFDFTRPELREALAQVAELGGSINSRRLGSWLGDENGTILGGFRLTKHGVVNGIAVWRIDGQARSV